jgi:hypothetical protein
MSKAFATAPLVGAKPWRYGVSIMATETATIRVPCWTRDQLRRRAKERGVSLSALVTEYAEALAREVIYRSEREATRDDARNRDAAAEDLDWEAAVADGIE